ncbi:hypothetical protein M0R45_030622 [Rubus argutus]|uniref:Uncharacterized protein n=1 Tax=Rubus argutus TaxID=59490 RepID=A0AAW1WFN9_RUBAR
MELSVIDLSLYLESKEGKVRDLCGKVSRSLRETGALLVKDPRCTVQDNDRFLEIMERYFDSPSEFKRLQERPQLHYQVAPQFFSFFM